MSTDGILAGRWIHGNPTAPKGPSTTGDRILHHASSYASTVDGLFRVRRNPIRTAHHAERRITMMDFGRVANRRKKGKKHGKK
jgi:hypothetical protein